MAQNWHIWQLPLEFNFLTEIVQRACLDDYMSIRKNVILEAICVCECMGSLRADIEGSNYKPIIANECIDGHPGMLNMPLEGNVV